MRKLTAFILLTLSFIELFAQEQTIGLLSYKKDLAYEGYTLIYPREQPSVFLLNNCGEIVHQWDDDPVFVPNNAVYLLDNGNLLKCKKQNNGPIGSGAGQYFVELLSWDNELLWSYELNTETERIHHDVEILPNGNILMIAWEKRTLEEAIANGRLTKSMTSDVLYPDFIFEINPTTNERVWEWHVWDHLIQDADSIKLNYGVIEDHPELVDLNYVENTNSFDWDWLHMNAIDYNDELDQIMLCVPYFNEIWIIDHSTTQEEAAGHSGGKYGKGGDLLYRVGNPLAYKRGTEEDKILFFPHDTHWTNEFIDDNHPDYNKILVFNNRVEGPISKMEIFENPWNPDSLAYTKVDGLFQPSNFENSITHPESWKFYSQGLSSVQVLPNGNILGCSGGQGYLMEITRDNEIVWEYKVPIRSGVRMPQGSFIDYWQNLTFRAFKFPPEYQAFDNRDLSSKGFIELEPNNSFCDSLTSVQNLLIPDLQIFPNPTSSLLHIEWSDNKVNEIKIFNLYGKEFYTKRTDQNSEIVDTSEFPKGTYVIIIDNTTQVLFVVQ